MADAGDRDRGPHQEEIMGKTRSTLRSHYPRWCLYVPNKEELQGRVKAVREVWERERLAVGNPGRLSQSAVFELALRLGLEAVEKHFEIDRGGSACQSGNSSNDSC